MSQLTVRKVDKDLIRRLKARAVEHNRSAEAEHRAILESVLRPKYDNFWQQAEQMRARLRGREHTDSAELIRTLRDRDHKSAVE